MTKHIAIYSDDPDKGGVAQYNHRIAMALAGAGYRVTLIQSRSTVEMVSTRTAAGIGHWWIEYDTGKDFVRTISDPADAERAFESLKPDLVVFCDCCPVSNLAAKEAAIRRGIRFVAIVHFVAPYLAERFARCLRLLARQYVLARGVVAVSSENLDELRRLFGLPAGKGRVIFYGVAPRFFRPRSETARKEIRERLKIPEATVVSLTAARLSPVKLHLLQIHAMEMLRAQVPQTRLICVWAGDGELRSQLETEIAQRKLADRFILAGQHQDVEPWYDMADLFSLTSQSEGMPLSIMEAMAKGLPVVATSVSGVPEELGCAGALLADPARGAKSATLQLAQTWLAWSSNADLRKEVGLRCRQRAERLFKEETMIENTKAFLEEAMAAPGPR